MKPHRVGEGERSLAVFIDFENMGLGFNGRRDRFEISKVLERLVEKGKIVCKKAYADWSRFGGYTGALHEAAIELIEIPRRGITGKNSADIRLVVDAIDLAYSKDHIDTFVIVSGDSDFSPLVSKLKELGKHVLGLGLADATSALLRDNCDEFIYYEDLDRAPIIPVSVNDQIPEKKRKVFAMLLDSLLALRRENKEVIYSSMLKDTIKRKKPSFNEEYYGYRTFSELLEDAQKEGLLEIDKHKSSGMYVVTRFGLELQTGGPTVVSVIRNGNDGRRDSRPVPLPAAPVQPRAALPPASRTQPPEKREERPEPAPTRPAAPPAQRPVAPPQKPAAGPPVTRVAAPLRPAAPAAPPEPPTPPSGSRTLGRALVDDLDDLDFDDEVPSYAPAKPAAKPQPASPPPAAKKPAERAPRKAAAPKPAPAAKENAPPKPAPVAKESAAPKPVRAPKAAPAAPAAEVPQPPPQPKPAAPPKPAPRPALDDDDFGAGIGD
jgi:uncharacterized protein (TIGR00288 family)